MPEDFSQKWRKQQACDRCRRFKVRCQYETPEDSSCIRCTKANATCAITSGGPNGPSSSSSSSSGISKKKLKKVSSYSSVSPKNATAHNNCCGGEVNITNGTGPNAEAAAAVQSFLQNNGSVVSPSNSVHSLGGGGSGNPVCDDCIKQKRPVTSEEEQLDRIQLLRKRVQDAEDEISMLKSLDFTSDDRSRLLSAQLKYRQQKTKEASGSGVNDEDRSPSIRLTSWLPAALINRENCMAMAVDHGLYTRVELQSYFQIYVTDLALYLPFPITDRQPIEEMQRTNPLLTLTAITCSAVCSSLDKATERVAFLERVVGESVFIEHHLSLELQMVLIMMTIFIPKKMDRQGPFRLLISLAVSLSLDLGSNEDIDVLTDPSSDAEAVRNSFRRTRAYVSLCTCIAGMALNSARTRLLQVMSHCERCCDALLPRAPDYDKPVVYLLKMMLFFNESIEKLRDTYEPFSSLMIHYERTIKKLEDLYQECHSTSLKWLDRRYLIPIQSCFQILSQSLNECMMGRLAILDTAEPQFRQLWYRFAQEIKRLAAVIIDGFLELASINCRFPNFMYFRPLHAVTSLIRLRLVSWSMRLDIDVDVEGSFARVKEAWTALKAESFTGSYLYELLTKVEIWMNIKMGRESLENSSTQILSSIKMGEISKTSICSSSETPAYPSSKSSVETLHRIMREVITKDPNSFMWKRQGSAGVPTSSNSTSNSTPVPPIVSGSSAGWVTSSSSISQQQQDQMQEIQPSESRPVDSLPVMAVPPLSGLNMPASAVTSSGMVPPMDAPGSLTPASSSLNTSDSRTPPSPSTNDGIDRNNNNNNNNYNNSTNNNDGNNSMMYMGYGQKIDPMSQMNVTAQMAATQITGSQIDTGMLGLMYVDENGFPNQPYDIENLLVELFNEVNSAQI